MRKTSNTKQQSTIIICILLILLTSNIITSSSHAQGEKNLIMNIYDHHTGAKITDGYLFENQQYDIEIADQTTNTITYNAIITTPWNTNIITTEMPNLLLQAPTYEEYPHFIITASKEGHLSIEQTVFILKGTLFASLDEEKVEEQQTFQVIVRDQKNTIIQGATVTITSIQNSATTTTTQGKAFLIAPDVDTTKQFTITIFKEGYLATSTTILVENIPTVLLPVDTNTLYIIIAVIILIIAILFVTLRQRIQTKKQMSYSTQISEQPKPPHLKKQTPVSTSHYQKAITKPINTTPERIHIQERSSKIEEIRIQGSSQKKETQVISAEKNYTSEKTETKKDAEEWFNGTDYMRYKLDELTGKIDSQTTGKWFEGVDTIKTKVDEKLKKNHKKKSDSP